MEWAPFWVRVGTFSHESCPLHLVPYSATTDNDLFRTYHNNLLATQKLFGDNGGHTAKHMVTPVNNNYFLKYHDSRVLIICVSKET